MRVFIVARLWLHSCRHISKKSYNFQAKKGFPQAADYVKKSPSQHILLRPETYVGTPLPSEHHIWLYNHNISKMEFVSSTFSIGLVKIFDEILVNAADNKQRDPGMTEIRVNVDREKNEISVWNNGFSLPIEIHPEENVHVATLVFGNLFTSSNYDDSELRTVGGRNGFGAKLCNVFSRKFMVETGEANSGRRFKQTWTDNMKTAEKPSIEKGEFTDYTSITFSPDLARFGLKELSTEVVEIFQRRTIDVAGTLSEVDVYFNGELIPIRNFKEYISLFTDDFLFLNCSKRWKIGLVPSSSGFRHISFVNNINTIKGGRHVEIVAEKLANSMKRKLEKIIGGRNIRNNLVKEKFFLFINCLIDNPSFESQTKEFLCTPPNKFGSVFDFDEEILLRWAESSGFLQSLADEILSKKNSSTKRNSKVVQEVAKLEDASLAGGLKGHQCSLIVTEGDSAKAFAVAGLEIVGRDRYGVFPIRGKLINVTNFDEKRTMENEEVSNLIKILGLKFGMDYSLDQNFLTLRYGSLIILADQDEDGSHIKGLLLNLFYHYWPQLVKRQFVSVFRTPLLKVKDGSNILSFFSTKEFKKWRATNKNNVTVKYYKGLGTSTSAEAREYFSKIDNHLIPFSFENDEDGQQLKMAFDKTKIEERKDWISAMKKEEEQEKDNKTMKQQSVKDFVNHELINYSLLDLKRSIPSVVDGLKPSQRKILHCMLQHYEKKEIKVNQLAGSVALHQSYHHGEESLVETIIKMAQTFPGSNNVNLLQPIGQFGTRHSGGEDAAKGRYIYTALSPITRLLFPKDDDNLLEFVNEDGHKAEPIWFAPIIPTVLVNGAVGIGTGWATNIPSHRPSVVIDSVKRLIEEKEIDSLIPWWRDFHGAVSQIGDNRFMMKGIASVKKRTKDSFGLEITELPIGVWTDRYKKGVLLPLAQSGNISFKEYHSEKNVRFSMTMKRFSPFLKDALLRKLRLVSTFSTNSMVLFDPSGNLRTFNGPMGTVDMMKCYFAVRRDLYKKRIVEIMEKIEKQHRYTENQLRFVNSVVRGDIILSGRSRNELEIDLINRGFESNPLSEQSSSLSYLLEMPLIRLTTDEINRLEQKSKSEKEQLVAIQGTSWQDVWMKDLDALTKELQKIRLL